MPAAWKASWAPDSKRLAFTRQGGGISVLELESGQVTDLGSNGKDPAWSPDGKFIAYVGGTGLMGDRTPREVWVIPAAGGDPVKIGGGEFPNAFPHWTPDSKRVLFHTDSMIVSVALDALQEEPTVVFADRPGQAAAYPSISPDGSRIAYGGEKILRVFDTKSGVIIASLAHSQSGLLAGWSPDGRQLAFGGFFADLGLWIFDLERGGAYLVATNGTMPAWSPDGKRLVFDVREDVRVRGPLSPRELWVVETASLPRNPVLTNQIPRYVTTNRVPAIGLTNQVPASVVR